MLQYLLRWLQSSNAKKCLSKEGAFKAEAPCWHKLGGPEPRGSISCGASLASKHPPSSMQPWGSLGLKTKVLPMWVCVWVCICVCQWFWGMFALCHRHIMPQNHFWDFPKLWHLLQPAHFVVIFFCLDFLWFAGVLDIFVTPSNLPLTGITCGQRCALCWELHRNQALGEVVTSLLEALSGEMARSIRWHQKWQTKARSG